MSAVILESGFTSDKSSPQSYPKLGLICMAVALLAISGCASTPKDTAELSAAREAVATAESNPAVSQYASVELDKARKMLAEADRAAKEHEKPMVRNQYAYLAKQNALIAVERAKSKLAEAELAKGDAERTKIQLAARENEVTRAQSQAASARSAADQAMTRANQSEEEKQRLMNEIAQLKATPTPRGIVLTLGDVLFDTGKAELKSGASREVSRLVEFLKTHQERKVQVEGFTDARGSDSYNLSLSDRRASAVRDTLVSSGIDSARVTTKGYGKAYPVASNDEASGRQLNRRVEIIISNDAGDIPAR